MVPDAYTFNNHYTNYIILFWRENPQDQTQDPASLAINL
jgi:hypothetical protein